MTIAKAEFDENGYLLHGANLLYKCNPTYFVFEEESLDALQNSRLFLRKILTETQAESPSEI